MKDNELVERFQKAPRPGLRIKVAPNEHHKVITPVIVESDGSIAVVYEIEQTAELFLCDPKNLNRSTRRPDCSTLHWGDRPQPGSRWRHFKGDYYKVVGNCFDVLFGFHYVIYKAETDGLVWARDISEWLTLVKRDGQSVQRFEAVA